MRSDSSLHLRRSSPQYLPLRFPMPLCFPTLAQVPSIHLFTCGQCKAAALILSLRDVLYSSWCFWSTWTSSVHLWNIIRLFSPLSLDWRVSARNCRRGGGQVSCVYLIFLILSLGYFSLARKYRSFLNEDWGILMRELSRKSYNECDYVIP